MRLQHKKHLKFSRKVALVLVFLLSFQMAFPPTAFALTSGPTQPEVQSFEPVNATQMVDLFSGDFTYNIPLLEVPGPDGGYPINLFYNSVTTGEAEATMVGLGWNIGIGNINRQMQGLPDDFNGDVVTQNTQMKKNTTVGFGPNGSIELFGADFEKLKLFKKLKMEGVMELSLGINVLHNSYKGWGYSIDPGIKINMGKKESENGLKLSGGLGFSLNSLNGVSVNANASLGQIKDKSSNDINFGYGFSGRYGNSLTLGVSLAAKNKKKDSKNTTSSSFLTASFLREPTTYTPKIAMPFTGENLTVGFATGGSVWGTFGRLGFTGFYSTQRLKQPYQATPAYGYLHLENADQEGLMDFNREKDGGIRQNQPNLAVPISTPDILSVVGHGIGGAYRPYRSDVGVYYDQKMVSTFVGGAVKVDASPAWKTGVDINLNEQTSSTKLNKKEIGDYKFIGANDVSNADYEPYYYKRAGEMTADYKDKDDYLHGDKVLRVGLKGYKFEDKLKGNLNDPNDYSANQGHRQNRKVKNTVIQPLTNKELLDNSGNPIIPYYDIQYYNGVMENQINEYDYSGSKTTLVRDSEKKDQIAGYTHNAGGARWNFGLPVMNNVQKSVTFSVNGDGAGCGPIVDIPKDNFNNINYKFYDEYLDITEMPAYAHSYLLTSILGADYIDVDPTDGLPNDGDRGYWMIVEYVKTADDYKWRAPFVGANLNRGYITKLDDDKGTFTYGTREVYQPAIIKTKTHIAEFNYEERKDGQGAATWLQDNNSSTIHGEKVHKLTSIDLYSKLERYDDNGNINLNATPIKTVHFEYDYSLTGNTLNNDGTSEMKNGVNINSNKGKLTLKKVWFTYENSNRGALSPYKFTYNSSNPNYDIFQFDGWGTFKSNGGDQCANINNPYVEQNTANGNDPDADIASWHLEEINLPSGATIKVDVGRDHYSHVQNRVATQMFKIDGPGLLDKTGQTTLASNDATRRIYFEFENGNPLFSKEEMNPYFEDLYVTEGGYRQLYYKTYVDLTNDDTNGSNSDLYEEVTGYAEIQDFNIDESSGNQSSGYTRGYVELRNFPIAIDGEYYHPMLVNNWQFLKVNLPDRMYGYDLGSNTTTTNGKEEKADKVKKLGAMFFELVNQFKDYYKVCRNEDYGRRIDLSRSFIKLNTPDKLKYGGGIRVNKVVLFDDWTEEETPAYGTVYDYTNENGQSTGVATNEPAPIQDESALRYAKSFTEDLKARTDNRFFYEHPINESYYPGASVGYEQVIVKSLATEYAIRDSKNEPLPVELPSNLPDGFATSGVTVQKFHTAKDYPIITSETDLVDKTNDKPFKRIPIPFLGSMSYDYYSGTQGYSIELNDMHGKPKEVAQYGIDKNSDLIEPAISWVKYEYFEEKHPEVLHSLRGEGANVRERKRITSEVPIWLADEAPSDPSKAWIENDKMEMGVEREFFMDVRQFEDQSFHGGSDFNVDMVQLSFLPFPIPTGWAEISTSHTRVRTAVTNKIIRRSGILKRAIAYDGQSEVITENKVFDRYTGQALLTTVNNNYDNPVYNYSIPAYSVYDQMGPAYLNQGLKFSGTLGSTTCDGYEEIVMASAGALLVAGDEFIVSDANHAIGEATFMKQDGNAFYFDIDVTLAQGTNYNFHLIRSGRRNYLGAGVASISSLTDPTENREIGTQCSTTIDVAQNGGTVESETITIDVKKINDVLSTGAATFGDTWDIISEDQCTPVATTTNPYRSGAKGIWRGDGAYAYVTNRVQSNNVNLETDGHFNDMPLFNWENPFFVDCVEEWRSTNQVTKYAHNGAEVENKNILDIYSSAMYGYKDNLVTAVGANARYYEIGYEGFEEYGEEDLFQLANDGVRSKGHIDLFNPPSCNGQIMQSYTIHGGVKPSSDFVVLEEAHNPNMPIPTSAIFTLKDTEGNHFHTEPIPVSSLGNWNNLQTLTLSNSLDNECLVSNNGATMAGTVSLIFDISYTDPFAYHWDMGHVLITAEKAHTGKYSLKLGTNVPNNAFTYPQQSLQLEVGKKYVVSAWVSFNLETHTYDFGNNQIGITINGTHISPSGAMVDGWQRIEGAFTYDGTPLMLQLLKGNNDHGAAYFDDIRIFPSEGNIQTYVYDPMNYRLTEVLDNNNFFTRYHYDEEGNLTIVKKETIKGIKTLQESRTFVKPNSN